MNDRLAIGRIGRPHGVHGALRVHSYSEETEHFGGLDELLLKRDTQERTVRVVSMEVHGRTPVLRFEGVSSPEAARAFTGYEILVSRDAAAPLDQDEYYVADLVGLGITVAGATVGRIEAVIDAPQAPLLEVSLTGAGRTVLIPFLQAFVGEPDRAANLLELKAPWLLSSE